MGKKAGRRRAQEDPGGSSDEAGEQSAPANPGKQGQKRDGAPGAVNWKALECVALKSHHGKHIKAEAGGEVRAASAVVKEQEKFSLVHAGDGSFSLRSCHGTFLTVDQQGYLRASGTTPDDDASKFEAVAHEDGMVSLKNRRTRAYVAAECKGGKLRANRMETGAWEKFQVKDRSQRALARGADPAMHQRDSELSGSTHGAALAAPQPPLDSIPLFDALCHLQDVLLAEERYARSHSDHVANGYKKRAFARRQRGVHLSFPHFCSEHKYPTAFRACISAFDAAVVRLPEEHGVLQCSTSDGEDAGGASAEADVSQYEACTAWSSILAESSPAPGEDDAASLPRIYAAFGIPAASAAEADEAAFARLAVLCGRPECVALGPIGLDFTPLTPVDGKHQRHLGLSASRILVEFGAGPRGAYDPKRDPLCVSWVASTSGLKPETWVLKHGDRRLAEFEAAVADYARRRSEAQVHVAERQVRLALELDLPLVIQLPPQEEAERQLAQLLTSVLPEGSDHPILLSAFTGRPKCAAALLKHLPGVMVAFSGLLTHGKMKDSLGEVAFDTPLDRLLLESLGPLFPPSLQGVSSARGSYSHPLHVADVAEELARVKGISAREVREAAYANALRFFRLSSRLTTARTGSS